MDINDLISTVKKKIIDNVKIEKIDVVDKSFLHKKHPGNEKNKYHLKILIESEELKKINRIDANKKIYKILDKEMKFFIHSLQILIV